MLSAYRRHGLIIALALVAGIASLMVRQNVQAVWLPRPTTFLAGTEWTVRQASLRVTYTGVSYQEWSLVNRNGARSDLYLQVTSKAQNLAHWSGELGYAGAGFVVRNESTGSVALRNGQKVAVDVATIERLGQQWYVLSAEMTPNSINAHATDDLIRLGWDVLNGSSGPFYMIRVSVRTIPGDTTAAATARSVMSPVLSTLRASYP